MTTNDTTTFTPGQHVTVRMGRDDTVHGIVQATPEGGHDSPNYVWVQTTRDSRPMKYRQRNVTVD